jgi:hypothetical protein
MDKHSKPFYWVQGKSGLRDAWILLNREDRKLAVVTKDGRAKYRWCMAYHLSSTQSSGKKRTLEEAQAMCTARAILIRPLGQPVTRTPTEQDKVKARMVLAVGEALAGSALTNPGYGK